MSEDLNKNLELQNLVTLQLVGGFSNAKTSIDQFSKGLIIVTNNFNQLTRDLQNSISGMTHAITYMVQEIGKSIQNAFPYAGTGRKSNMFKLGQSLANTSPISLGTKDIKDIMLPSEDSSKGSSRAKLTDIFAPITGIFKGMFSGGGIGYNIAGPPGALAGGPIGAVGGLIGGFGKVMSPLVNSFKTMGPSMIGLTLATKPVAAFLGALLEPFDMVIDLFEAAGSILGTALVPVMKSVSDVLIPILPLLVASLDLLNPVLAVLKIPLELLGVGVSWLSEKILMLGEKWDIGGKLENLTGGITDWVSSLKDNTDALDKNRETYESTAQFMGEGEYSGTYSSGGRQQVI